MNEFMEGKNIRIGLVQVSAGHDIEKNRSLADERIRDAAARGARIICLPELFKSRYFPQFIGRDITPYCDPVKGPFIEKFSELAAACNAVLIIPFCEKGPEDRIFNSALVIDADGTIFPPYHKVHLPQDPLFYEKGYFYPGDEYKVFRTRYADISVLICFDQWFPEAARSVALMGAEIICYPTSIGHIRGEMPAEGDWKESWQTIQRSHAIASSVPVVAVNRCGWEDDIFFFGGSFACDAFGTILAEAGEEEAVIVVDIDLAQGPCICEGWGFFKNRRPDTYGALVRSPSQTYERNRQRVPADLGYHMPAEWERHDAVWMAWPRNPSTFLHLEAVESTYLEILAALQPSERIELLVRDEETIWKIRGLMEDKRIPFSHIRFHMVPYSDVWIRDYGPTFLVNRGINSLSAVSWEFNAWGNKYDDLIHDGRIARETLKNVGISPFMPGIIMEGGSFDVNGRGCALTTRSCLLNPNRNPSLSQAEIEDLLCDYLGLNTIIWLSEGIEGDDTDGHIDDIARFAGPSTVLCAVEDNPEDPNYHILQEHFSTLSAATDQDGNPLTVIPVPMPRPVRDENYQYPKHPFQYCLEYW